MLIYLLSAGTLFAQTDEYDVSLEEQASRGHEIREEDFTEEAIITKRNLTGRRRYHMDNASPSAPVSGYDLMIPGEDQVLTIEQHGTTSTGDPAGADENLPVDNIDPPEPPELSMMFFYPLLALAFFASSIYHLYIKNRLS